MREGKTKRKDLIKNVAIVFLSVLLVLTFFSNTIMNYSLPEVATVFVQQGNITTRIRGTGTVEAADPYSVVAAESRTIRSVPVRVGDEVEKDAVIYLLEEGDSRELKQAEEELANMELAFMQKLFSGEIRSNIINRVDAGNFRTYDDFKNQLTNALSGEANAENQVEDLERNVEEMQRRLASLGAPSGDQVALKDELLLDVERASAHVLYTLNGILLHYLEVALDSEDAALTEARTKAILKSLHDSGAISKGQYDASFKAYDQVLERYNNNLRKLEDAIKVAENNFIIARQAVREARERAGIISDNRSDVVADIQAELIFNNLVAEIDAKKAEIEKLKEKSTGDAVTAPVAGIITALNHVAGETIQLDTTVAVIQVAGKGFSTSFTVTNEQASRVKVGDPAEIQSGWWWFNDLSVVLTGIRPDPNNPGQQRELIFTVTGEVQAGQQLNISVGQRSAQYELTVPNSAIREDSNSQFILIVETRNTPISNRYYATRVDVDVIAQDDNNSAITAPLVGFEYVITTATKPVQAGQQIRLTN
ncbi:MAG: HlyD family efflux transporter periplasmic adaptor subunit [Lachnospiraceae bacterium]|nr:HlyD family efflux transporter periplasmic adaptor subunit [Lachnospiraceae bacterium]